MTASVGTRRKVRQARVRRGSRVRLTLRILGERDVPALLAHRRAMMLEVGGTTPPTVDRYLLRFRRWLLPRLKSGRITAFGVTTATGHIVGSGCVWNAPDHPRPERRVDFVPYLFSMYTEPAFRGQGVATRVVRAAERTAKAAGATQLRLHAAPGARRLYRELGFVRGWEMRKRLGPAGRIRRRGRPSSTRLR